MWGFHVYQKEWNLIKSTSELIYKMESQMWKIGLWLPGCRGDEGGMV